MLQRLPAATESEAEYFLLPRDTRSPVQLQDKPPPDTLNRGPFLLLAPARQHMHRLPLRLAVSFPVSFPASFPVRRGRPQACQAPHYLQQRHPLEPQNRWPPRPHRRIRR